MGFSLLGPRKAQLVAQYMKPIFGRLRLERRGIHPTQPSLQGNDFFVAINRTPSKPSCKSGTKAQVQTPTLNMQSIRDSILRYVRVRRNNEPWFFAGSGNVLKRLSRQMRASSGTGPDQIMDRVIGLVKKFDKIDADKVTETADFQKDLSLDSLDRVELVMAFEAEFSIEIPEEKADKLTCCADVAKYIAEENTIKS